MGNFGKAIGLLETNCECGLAKGMWTVDLFEFGWRVALREVCCNNAIRRKWNSRTNGEAVMSLGILKAGEVRRCGGSLLCLGKNPDSSTESSTLFPRIKLQQITLNVPRASVSCTTLNNSSLYIWTCSQNVYLNSYSLLLDYMGMIENLCSHATWHKEVGKNKLIN